MEKITPFWQRIPKFFRFPFHAEPLLYAAFLALASLLDLFLPHLFGMSLVEAGILLAFLRYAFRIIEQTSLGYLSPNEYQLEASLDTVYLPYKMFAILVLVGLLVGVAHRASPVLGFLLNLFSTLALPAIVMVLTMTGSFIDGINPGRWTTVMRAVGWPYLALWLFLFLLMTGPGTALQVLWPLLGGWLTLPVVNFTFIYFGLVMAQMTGYVLYQYHESLGLEVKVAHSPEHKSRATGSGGGTAATDPIGDAIAQHVAEGDLKSAVALAREQQEIEPDNIAGHERYHKLLILAEDKASLVRHGPSYIEALLRKDRGYQALEVFKSLRAEQPDLAPERPEHAVPLARAAQRRGEHTLALTFLRGFERRHGRHKDGPAALLLSAQILAEHLHQDELARSVLQHLLAKYPEAPATTEARLYLRTMDRMDSLRAADTASSPPAFPVSVEKP